MLSIKYHIPYTKNLQKKADKIINKISSMQENILSILLNKTNEMKYNDLQFKFLGQGDECIVYQVGNFAIKIYVAEHNKDVDILKMLKELYNKHIAINTVILYGNIVIHKHLIVVVNVANGTLDNWVKNIISKKDNNIDEKWLIMLIQILYGMYVLQKELKLYHADLTHRNILYVQLDKFIKINYSIGKYKFSIITDIIFIISDFGKSQSMLLSDNKLSNSVIQEYINNNKDFEFLSGLYNKNIVDYMYKFYTYDELLKIVKDDMNINAYITSLEEKLEEKGKRIKKPKWYNEVQIRRSLCYYILEHNYLDINTIPNINTELFLPSVDIKNIIETLKDSNSIISKIQKCHKLLLNYDNTKIKIYKTLNINV